MEQMEQMEQILNYYDAHLSIPILDFYSSINKYSNIQTLKYSLIQKTKMFDSIEELSLQLFKTSYPNYTQLRSQTLSLFDSTTDTLQLAQLQYSTGQYAQAAISLNTLPNSLQVQWAKLASFIAASDSAASLASLDVLISLLESSSLSNIQLLHQRSWALHWSLYVYLRFSNDGLVDLFLKPQYINTIQMASPWLLKYLVATVITFSRKSIKDLNKIISLQSTKDDPILDFFNSLFYSLDLENAKHLLPKCSTEILKDFFLAPLHDQFMQAARQCLFETFLKIYLSCDFSRLKDLLNLKSDSETQKWILDYSNTPGVVLEVNIDNQKQIVYITTRKRYEDKSITSKFNYLVERSHRLSIACEASK